MKAFFYAVLSIFLSASGSVFANPPNIIVFILDDVGQADVGAFGNTVIQTPNIDRLATEGMRFENAFLTTSSCSPSRASILTGLYPSATGARNLNDPVPVEKTSLPQLLRNAGYYTASVGKWHLGEPFKSHFDRVVEDREESGAADWLPEISRRPKDKPFFFWLASKDAHAPYKWHLPLRHYSPAEVPLPYYAEDNVFTRQVMAEYYDEISRADWNIGLVVDALRQQNLLDNTLIIVLSDNGSQIGGAKTTLYDEGLKTPLVMRLPESIPQNVVNQQLVSAVDLMPTILQLADAPSVVGAPGISLLPTLHNSALPVRSYIYAERNRHGSDEFERVLRTKNSLYKRNYFGRRLCDPMSDTWFDPNRPRDSAHEEFYDLQRDPAAHANRLSEREYKGDLNTIRQQLSDIMAESVQHPPPLVFEQCKLRPWHERIRWSLFAAEE